MPNLPISQLPELSAITPNAEFAVAQNGVTYKVKAGVQSTGNLHASFHSEVTQYVQSANTATVISAETVNFATGITVSNNSKFTVSSGGTYNLQFSSVFQKIQGGSIEYVSIWLRKNNNNMPWTNTDISMANNNELIVASWNFLIELNPGDYLELMWSSTTTQMEMLAVGTQTNPSRPGTPSVIITVTQI